MVQSRTIYTPYYENPLKGDPVFTFKTQTDDSGLQEAIDNALIALKDHKPETKEYSTIVDQLDKLYGMRRKPNSVSKDALVGLVGNLFGIGMILGFEKTNVITTKAMSFVKKS